MRRFLFFFAFWLYIILEQILTRASAALFFGVSWGRVLVWVVGLIFLLSITGIVWRDRKVAWRQQEMNPLPTRYEFFISLGMLTLLIVGLCDGMNTFLRLLHNPLIPAVFNTLFGAVQCLFWGVVGLWGRDVVETLIRVRQQGFAPSR